MCTMCGFSARIRPAACSAFQRSWTADSIFPVYWSAGLRRVASNASRCFRYGSVAGTATRNRTRTGGPCGLNRTRPFRSSTLRLTTIRWLTARNSSLSCSSSHGSWARAATPASKDSSTRNFDCFSSACRVARFSPSWISPTKIAS